MFAAQIVFPKPEDTAYYVGVARNLVEGRGLVADAIWSYQTPPLVFPRPAFEVWLPLPSFLAAIPMLVAARRRSPLAAGRSAIGGGDGRARSCPSWPGAWPPTWPTSAALPAGRARTLAIGTGLTTAVYLPLLLHSALPDSTMPFAALALGACLLMTRIARDPRGARLRDPRLVGLGLLLGLAALTRNEAVWIGLAWAIVAWRIPGLDRGWQRARLIGVASPSSASVFAPWAIRDWLAFGSPLPGQARPTPCP